jgi:hypothetical protein
MERVGFDQTGMAKWRKLIFWPGNYNGLEWRNLGLALQEGFGIEEVFLGTLDKPANSLVDFFNNDPTYALIDPACPIWATSVLDLEK